MEPTPAAPPPAPEPDAAMPPIPPAPEDAAPAAAPAADAPAAVPAPDTQAAAPVGSAKRILLVEDDDALANVYQTRLQAEGFDIKRVPNGEDALSVAIQFKPALILLDVMMPKVSGFDVLDILRNTPETNNVKVIMLTALSQDSDKARAQELGADDYLVKSQVVIADVVERIRHHLNIA
jgi:CheY-like chemotaxis protein